MVTKKRSKFLDGPLDLGLEEGEEGGDETGEEAVAGSSPNLTANRVLSVPEGANISGMRRTSASSAALIAPAPMQRSNSKRRVSNDDVLDVGRLVVNVRMIEAKGLDAKDAGGTSDPFAVVRLRTIGDTSMSSKVASKSMTGCKDETLKGHHIEKTLEPQWNDMFRFTGVNDVDVAQRELHVSLWDWNLFSSPDFMGHFSIPLQSVFDAPMRAVDQWVALETRGIKKEVVTGQAHVQLALMESRLLDLPSRMGELKYWCEERRVGVEEEMPQLASMELSKTQRHAYEALWELVSTERNYVRDVEVICRVFVEGTAQRCLLSRMDTKSVFSNIVEIQAIHVQLVQAFNKAWRTVRKDRDAGVAAMGQALRAHLASFKMYAVYCSNQKAALAAVNMLRSRNTDLDAFLTDAVSLPECRNQNLNSFLIMPLQRLCKYPLLLREIIKNVDDGDHLADMRTAMDEIGEIATHVNERTAQAERVNSMMSLQSQVENTDKYSIVGGGRHLLRESQVTRMDSNKPATVFVFNDAVAFANKKTAKDGRTTYEIKDMFDLASEVLGVTKSGGGSAASARAAQASSGDLTDPTVEDCRFMIAFNSRRPLRVQTATACECDELVSVIAKARDELDVMAAERERRGTGPPGFHANTPGGRRRAHDEADISRRRSGTQIGPSRTRSSTGAAAVETTSNPIQDLLRQRRLSQSTADATAPIAAPITVDSPKPSRPVPIRNTSSSNIDPRRASTDDFARNMSAALASALTDTVESALRLNIEMLGARLDAKIDDLNSRVDQLYESHVRAIEAHTAAIEALTAAVRSNAPFDHPPAVEPTASDDGASAGSDDPTELSARYGSEARYGTSEVPANEVPTSDKPKVTVDLVTTSELSTPVKQHDNVEVVEEEKVVEEVVEKVEEEKKEEEKMVEEKVEEEAEKSPSDEGSGKDEHTPVSEAMSGPSDTSDEVRKRQGRVKKMRNARTGEVEKVFIPDDGGKPVPMSKLTRAATSTNELSSPRQKKEKNPKKKEKKERKEKGIGRSRSTVSSSDRSSARTRKNTAPVDSLANEMGLDAPPSLELPISDGESNNSAKKKKKKKK